MIKLVSYIVIVTSFWLAVNAFWAANYVDDQRTNSPKNNVYLSTRISHNANLADVIDRESTQLDFMVWPQERSKLSRKLSELLHQRINLSPFNGRLWTQLISLQKDAGTDFNDRIWTIERAARLLRWNVYERSNISHYCIAEYDEFQKTGDKLCSSLISNLFDQWTDHQHASKANVALKKLQYVLRLEQTKLNEGRQ